MSEITRVEDLGSWPKHYRTVGFIGADGCYFASAYQSKGRAMVGTHRTVNNAPEAARQIAKAINLAADQAEMWNGEKG